MFAVGTPTGAQGEFEFAGGIYGAVDNALLFKTPQRPVEGDPVNRAEQLLQIGLGNRTRTAQEYFYYLDTYGSLPEFVML
jgi:hypothetical protein